MSVEIEVAHVGQFVCSLEMLGRLLGLPQGVSIRDIEPTRNGVYGQPAVRIVVEDEEELPAVEAGEEIPGIAPQFNLGGTTYREFKGWGLPDPTQVAFTTQREEQDG